MIIGTPIKSTKHHKVWIFATTVLVACLYSSTPSSAEPEASAWNLETLMEAMAQVKSSSARYELVEHRSITTKPLVSSGKLVYKAPDYIERRSEKPLPGYFIVEKDNLRLKTEGQKERRLVLYQFPPIHALVEAMRSTLSGNIKTLKNFYQASLSGNRKAWTLKLNPLDEEMLTYVDAMTLHGSGTQLHRVETLEAGGDRSIMTVSDHGMTL